MSSVEIPPTIDEDKIVFKPNPGPQTAFLAASEREVLYGGPLHNDTLVITNNGRRRIEDIVVGDMVLTPKGTFTKVVDIPFVGEEESYRLTFSNGAEVIASAGHKWFVGTSDWAKTATAFRTKRTNELLDFKLPGGRNKNKYRLPVVAPFEFEERQHYISPYIMGVLLADGCVTKAINIFTADEETVQRCKAELHHDYEFVFRHGVAYGLVKKSRRKAGSLNDYKEELKRLGVFGHNAFTKFIPDEYLYDSIENRHALLQGLMDSDGTCRNVRHGRSGAEAKYTTVSEKLRDTFIALAESLGFNTTWHTEIIASGSTAYRININGGALNPFYLSRKASLYDEFTCRQNAVMITKIEPVGVQPVRCITVEDKDSLFVLDRNITTHNSAGGGKSFAILADPLRYIAHPQFSGLILRHTTEELRELIWKSQELYPKVIPGIKWSERKMQWEVPGGGRLWMSYLDRDDDVLRYQGLSFCVEASTPVMMLDGTFKSIADVEVGDKVATLERGSTVAYKSEKHQKQCVAMDVYCADGTLMTTQIHPVDHPVALLSDKPMSLAENVDVLSLTQIKWASFEQLNIFNEEYPIVLSRHLAPKQGSASYIQEFYRHPYNDSLRKITIPTCLGFVKFRHLDDCVRDVYDVTIEQHNHYITYGGVINRNCYIAWDELTQWPTPFAYNYMRSRLRSTAPDLPVYIRATTNPGNRGMAWVKKMFIDPAPPGKAFWATDLETGEVMTFPEGHEKAGQPLFKRRFIPAKLKDNPYLAANGEYETMLMSLPEQQRRQLLDGDWDISEGAAFTEFNRRIHVIEPFQIPGNWTKFRACDYGYGSHSAVLWFAVDPTDESLVVYRELYVSKVIPEDLATMVLNLERNETISYGILDSSCWHRRGEGPSIAEKMITRGCRWRPADRSAGSRVAGRMEMHRRLQVDPETGRPRIFFFNTCTQIIADLPTLPIDKNNPDDIDTKVQNDHSYDAARYGIMSRPRSKNIFDYDPYKNYSIAPADTTFGY